jgi:hypothetical protein
MVEVEVDLVKRDLPPGVEIVAPVYPLSRTCRNSTLSASKS